MVDPDAYLGIERDNTSLQLAKLRYPRHSFESKLPDLSNKFETIVSLAVIEHVNNPAGVLQTLSKYLEDTPSARVVITTPHPAVEWAHGLGAAIGLFSKHANEEHEDLLDRQKLEIVGGKAGLKLESYSRFLFGANQIATYSRDTPSRGKYVAVG